MNLIII